MLPGKLFLTISSGKCSKCLGLARTEMKCPPLRTWMRKTKTRSTTAVLKSGFSSNFHRYIKTSTTSIQILFLIIVFKLQVFQEKVFECDQWPFIKIGACKSWLSTTPNIHQCFKLSFFWYFFHGHRMYSCLSTTTDTTSWKKDVVNEQMFVLKIWVRLTVSKLS